jgi:hypothetical protein
MSYYTKPKDKLKVTPAAQLFLLYLLLSLLPSHSLTASGTIDLSPVLRLDYTANPPTICTLTISRQGIGWAGIGFGKNMLSGEVIVVERGNGSEVSVRFCRFAGHGMPACGGDSGGWKVVSSSGTASSFQVMVSKPCDTSLCKGIDDVADGFCPERTRIMYAYTSSNQMTYHDKQSSSSDFGMIDYDFSTGTKIVNKGIRGLIFKHEVWMTLLWLLPYDILLLLWLYSNLFSRTWQNVHLISLLLIVFLSFLSLNTGQAAQLPSDQAYYYKSTRISSFHKWVGDGFTALATTTLLALSTLRALRALQTLPSPQTLQILTKLFTLSSLFLWLTTRLIVLSGSTLQIMKYGQDGIAVYAWIESVLLGVLVFYLEKLRREWRDRLAYKYLRDEDSGVEIAKVRSEYLNAGLVEMINDIRGSMSGFELRKKYPNKKVVIFANGIYDVTDFEHPGGQGRIDLVNFECIEHLMLGIYKLDLPNELPWSHTKSAFEYLSSKRIGSLYIPFQANPDSCIMRTFSGDITLCDSEFTYGGRKEVSKQIALLKFTSLRYRVETDLKGYSWMSKYYIVTTKPPFQTVTILYDCISLAPEVTAHLDSLLTLFWQIVLGNGYEPDSLTPLPQTIDYLPLAHIFHPHSALLSSLAAQSDPPSATIQGPFGRGLCLPSNLTGHLTIIAEESGLIPFVDLIVLVLKKAMCLCLQVRGFPSDIVLPDQPYEELLPFVKVRLILLVEKVDERVFLTPLIEHLTMMESHFKLGLFESVNVTTMDKAIFESRRYKNARVLLSRQNEPIKELHKSS